jgi:hypothetical protein
MNRTKFLAIWVRVVLGLLFGALGVASYAQQIEHFGSPDASASAPDPALAKQRVQARAALRKQLAEEKAAGEKLVQQELAEEKASGEKRLREELAEEKAKAERDLEAYIAEKKAVAEKLIREKMAAAERKIFVPVETPSTSGQPNVQSQTKATDGFEEFLKKEQTSASAPARPGQTAATEKVEDFLKKEHASASTPERHPEPQLELNALLSELATQLQPRPNPGLTDIQHAEAEKNRVKSVYSDFYKKYGGRRALSTFVIDNVSEVPGQSRFILDVVPKSSRLSEGGVRFRGAFQNSPTCHPYVGLSSELIPSKAEALKVNRGDEVHCWATIDPDGKECVYNPSMNPMDKSVYTASPYRRDVQPLYTELFDRVKQFPHICIKDRIVYIASGNKLKLVLFGSKQVAQRLCDSSHGQIGPERDLKVWKDSTGTFSIQAKFNGVEDGSVVLKRTDSKLVRVRVERLCKEDQQYVLEQMKEQKREAEAQAERMRAEKEAEAEQAKREAEAKAKQEKIAKLLQGTIPLDEFLKEEQALRSYDASLTQVQNQLRNQQNTEAFLKNMDGKTIGCVATVSDVRQAGVTSAGDAFYVVDCTGDVVRQFYARSRLAESLNKGSQVVVKWTAKAPVSTRGPMSTQGPTSAQGQIEQLGLLGEASDIIQVLK